ncbi:hypothetical protein E2562_038092, partial [Oryza meyeriana var. granulata]
FGVTASPSSSSSVLGHRRALRRHSGHSGPPHAEPSRHRHRLVTASKSPRSHLLPSRECGDQAADTRPEISSAAECSPLFHLRRCFYAFPNLT